jgi:carbamoyl-phosphate synthase large subunit
MHDLRIILTACGAPGAPGIIKSYRRNQERRISILGTDMNREAVGFALVDSGIVVPGGTDSKFIDSLISICEKEDDVGAIVPLSTYELLPLAKNSTQFRKMGIKMALSSPRSLEVANDKARLYRYFSERNVSVPDFEVIDSSDELLSAAERLGYPKRQICFKPAVSKGSRGFRIVSHGANRISDLFDAKPDSTRTDLSSLAAILSESPQMPESLVMEYLPGREYSVDVLADRGKTLVAVPRLRREMRGGISFRATTIKDESLIELSTRVVSALSLHGNIGIQIREDLEGAPRLLEINPRLQGSIVLCTAAGINLPYLGLKLALGEEMSIPNVRWGIGMTRYWEEIFYDENGRPYSL